MRHHIVSLSHAKAKLLELTRRANEEGEAFLLTKDGTPVSALVPLADYEALLETADVRADPASLNDLERALADEAKGRLWRRDKRGRWIKHRPRKLAA